MLVTWRSLAPTYALAALATFAVAVFAVSWGTVHIAPQTTLAILIDHLPFISIGEHDATTDAIIWQALGVNPADPTLAAFDGQPAIIADRIDLVAVAKGP